MGSLKYEFFIRHAFNVGRGEDPAHLAEAGLYDFSRMLPDVKAATSYAACIYRNRAEKLESGYGEAYNEQIKKILAAESFSEIDEAIDAIKELPGFPLKSE